MDKRSLPEAKKKISTEDSLQTSYPARSRKFPDFASDPDLHRRSIKNFEEIVLGGRKPSKQPLK
jgi:hypothetical protein